MLEYASVEEENRYFDHCDAGIVKGLRYQRELGIISESESIGPRGDNSHTMANDLGSVTKMMCRPMPSGTDMKRHTACPVTRNCVRQC